MLERLNLWLLNFLSGGKLDHERKILRDELERVKEIRRTSEYIFSPIRDYSGDESIVRRFIRDVYKDGRWQYFVWQLREQHISDLPKFDNHDSGIGMLKMLQKINGVMHAIAVEQDEKDATV